MCQERLNLFESQFAHNWRHSIPYLTRIPADLAMRSAFDLCHTPFTRYSRLSNRWQPVWQLAVSCRRTSNRWMNSHCSFNELSSQVVQPVWQQVVSCKRGFSCVHTNEEYYMITSIPLLWLYFHTVLYCECVWSLLAFLWVSALSVKVYALSLQSQKNVPPLACYNFWCTWMDFHIFFGRNVTDKVGNQKTLYYATSNNLCFYTIR